MDNPKDAMEKVATGIAAMCKILQQPVAPDLREQSIILLQHAEALNATLTLLKEYSILLNRNQERPPSIERRLQAIDGRIDGLDGRLVSLENRVGGVEVRLASMESRFEAVSQASKPD